MWQCIDECLKNSKHAWSLGSYGAIAEFMWDEGEACHAIDDGRLGMYTERGGLAYEKHPGLVAIAYETLRKSPYSWGHAVTFCLPKGDCQANHASALTELGPDSNAIQLKHRQHILFDMGLGIENVDVHIRTVDEKLIGILREYCGTQLLAGKNPAMEAIVQAGPHRVFSNPLGRMEVYQPIGITKSPEGPHTHVLPKLLKTGRTSAPSSPIPDGLLPVLTLHPENPCVDILGQEKPFDSNSLDFFLGLLDRWGIPEYCEYKSKVQEQISDRISVDSFLNGTERLSRTASRIALRQHARLNPGDVEYVQSIRQRYDKINDKSDAHVQEELPNHIE